MPRTGLREGVDVYHDQSEGKTKKAVRFARVVSWDSGRGAKGGGNNQSGDVFC
jgi:hypothetical protein